MTDLVSATGSPVFEVCFLDSFSSCKDRFLILSATLLLACAPGAVASTTQPDNKPAPKAVSVKSKTAAASHHTTQSSTAKKVTQKTATSKKVTPKKVTPATSKAPSKAATSTSSRKTTSKTSSSGSKKLSTTAKKGVRSTKPQQSAHSHGQQGIEGDRARTIQEALIRAKYMDGEPSGVWDQKTKDALTHFQSDNGWQSKVVPDSRALIKLGLGPDHADVLNPETSGIRIAPSVGAPPAADLQPGGGSTTNR